MRIKWAQFEGNVGASTMSPYYRTGDRLPTRLSDFGPLKDQERGPLEGWNPPPCAYCGSEDHETGAAECQRELGGGEQA